MWLLLSTIVCLIPLAIAAPALENRAAAPSVALGYATVIGSSSNGIDSFKGIPYAQPPTGNLRLKPPQPITSHLGKVNATGTPRACPQFYTSSNSSFVLALATDLLDSGILQNITDAGEDCLTVNVQRPSTATSTSKLPVVFWIFGGGFEFGSTQTYDASNLVSTSVSQGKDIIYVSVNYRIGGFGFLAGSEIKKDGSSNIGLLDQRLGLQWVADNILKFGGDPSKVTIWGESAGSISVFDQMALYNGNNVYKGKPLFRAGMMDSGSIVPSDPVDGVKGNQIYSAVVKAAGCSGSADTLNCLRSVPYETYLQATTSVPGIFDYQSVALSYLPRPDGLVLTDSPEVLALNGQFAKVPFIIGDQEDEGTLFSLVTSNLSSTAIIVSYLKEYFFINAPVDKIQALVELYSEDPSAGSPYNTGIFNEVYPGYKRVASLLGDLVFTLTRRIFLYAANLSAPSVPSWSYLASYFAGTPVLGTFHASDILATYGILPGEATSTIQSYYISFINTMNPNTGTTGLPNWPQWSEGNQLIHFQSFTNSLTPDTFRSEPYNYLLNNRDAGFKI